MGREARDVKETGSNKLISNQGQLFPRAQSNGCGLLQGLILAKKVILTKFLVCGQKILSKIQNIHQLRDMVKKEI